jgi:predicted Zn-dependent protease
MSATDTHLGGYRIPAMAVLAALMAGAALAAPAPPPAGIAKVTSIQNKVETKPAAGATWSASKEGETLVANDRVRTGAASRASILYSDQTLHRLSEKSEVEILPPTGGTGSGVVKILTGQSYFTTRTPKDFGRVETPTVTAAIKGTEFAVAVADNGTTTITMIEGTVEASNAQGSVTVTRGEEAVAEPGKAPQKRIAVRPRDAVAWSLYYPPVLSPADRGNPQLDRAAAALAAGQVADAKRILDEVHTSDPKNPAALAMSSVVALTDDRRDDARSLADQALTASPDSPSALLARSYVAQADFDLDRALDLTRKAAARDPKNGEALARRAELELATGDPRSARSTAEAAVGSAPDNARALTVLGFVELSAYHTEEAAKNFEKALAADPNFPLAHAGHGIATIRRGKVAAGREELQTAATLDPGESLYRSYLGKAYYEEYRSKEAAKELDAAKQLDPRDPTPYLYSAILLENENRPIEALADLNGAIDRNDNRAVYRSRLLLDEDRAVRGTDLARIYADLGFDTLGLVAARRSADQDQANFSSHLFLAGNYRNLSSFAPSFLSETLQARIYQPIGANAARPEEQGGQVGFNEYTALFDRPRARGFVDATYGYTDTNLEGTPNTIDNSRNWSGNLLGTYNGDRIAASVGYQHYKDDGFRVNNDLDNTVYTAFVEVAPTDRDTVQVNAIYADRLTGDLPLRQVPENFFPERIQTGEWNVGLGWHRRTSPAFDFALSGIWNDTHQQISPLGGGPSSDVRLYGPQLEGQLVYRMGHVTWVGGAGFFDGTFDAYSAGTGDERFGNVYAYAKIRGMGPVELAVGAAGEGIDSPVGLLPPRDSNILPTDVTYTNWHLSPKLGVTATFKSATTLRAAVFSKMASAFGRLQTLEPTQVSGFNQFYEDVPGTTSWNYGVGLDQAFARIFFVGVSWLYRDLSIPEASCPAPDPFAGCSGQPGSVLFNRMSHDNLASLYVNMVMGKYVSGSIDFTLDKRSFDTTTISPLGLFQDRFDTKKLRPQVRVFLPIGFFASVTGTRYDQQVDQFDDLTSSARMPQTAEFWLVDAAVGWRLPRRIGSISLEGTNLLDHQFNFYQQTIQENVIPARRVLLRGDFAF